MKRAKSLMVLGTGSNVGKSVVAAGFCRILSDWGYRVAPFKAQNMSNNSCVTEEGGEMGRAQAVQAECARLKPHVDMNPVLLKPAADNSSQIVLQGRALTNLSARDYFAQRDRIARIIRESYERLAAAYEIIVLEGAGSPAEVNLKENDLVNMRMADLADAACVLVGDIDRGGIFASIIGTLDLLEPGERTRVRGLIVNKFRGDISLFENGTDFLEKRTGKKIWGVIPYERDLGIEEEDAVHAESAQPASLSADGLDVAVLLLPRMSNFTDFEVLKYEEGVRLRYLKRPQDFGSPDLLILPGTKSTMADLAYLEAGGFREKILDYAAQGGRVLGICGGYQMMGKMLLDPEGVESDAAEAGGLSFFEMTTRFSPEKILKRVSEEIDCEIFGRRVKGKIEAYEIHMGRTIHHRVYPALGQFGAVHPSGRLAGTYYHGLFDHAAFRRAFLEALGKDSGKARPVAGEPLWGDGHKELHYKRWARHLARSLNLEYLKECLQLSK